MTFAAVQLNFTVISETEQFPLQHKPLLPFIMTVIVIAVCVSVTELHHNTSTLRDGDTLALLTGKVNTDGKE